MQVSENIYENNHRSTIFILYILIYFNDSLRGCADPVWLGMPAVLSQKTSEAGKFPYV